MHPILALGTALDTVTVDVGTLVACALGLIILALVARLLNTLHKRWNVHIPDELQAKMGELIQKGVASAVAHGVGFAEKEAGKLSDSNKAIAEHAASWVLSMTDDKKIVEKGKEYIKKEVEAHLGQKAIDASPSGTP